MPKTPALLILLYFICSITLSFGMPGIKFTTPGKAIKNPGTLQPGNIIWSTKPASEWPGGYPIGNGRLGGMVLGTVQQERIALNHDLLWRQFWTYQNRNTSADIKKIRELNTSGQWDKGDDLALQKIPFTGNAIYINPYVPVEDLYINFHHPDHPLKNYRRQLDMENGVTTIGSNIANDIVKTAIFLASDDARYIIGQTIVIDGGTTSWMSFSEGYNETGLRLGKGYVAGL